MDYQDFLATKTRVMPPSGVPVDADALNPQLFEFQRDITRWALRKGRSAIFADTGLGKTFIQLEWARLIGEKTLIIAPLSVARQTIREAAKLGIDVQYARSQDDVSGPITITNYEMISKFNPSEFDAVVLDESSILKSLDGKTRGKLIETFNAMPYRLCCTATPAPNDISEIANHAEFLGVMSRVDMLATFFVHDDDGWRLKGHAEDGFYQWMASWGISVRWPSDLGYDDDGYKLPPLDMQPLWVEGGYQPEGMLFSTGLHGIQDRHRVRRESMAARVQAAADLANADSDQWILWCGMNAEADALAKAIPGAVNVQGSDSPEAKAAALEAFQDGRTRVLVTKPRIAGFGMNFQGAHKMAFVGLSDSWESYYQCVRRCWRFGQEHPVTARIVLSEDEQDIYYNVMRKESEAQQMRERLVEHVRGYEQAELQESSKSVDSYSTDTTKRDSYTMMLGDAVERLQEVEENSIGLSVYSPPFLSLYTYSPTERDIGNSGTEDEFFGHYRYVIAELLRVTKPGRLTCVHVSDVAAMLSRDGYIGMRDFPGATIDAYEAEGWIYHGRVTIDKNPQAQAIRTHSKGLLFGQLEKDSAWSRPAIADYILLFRKPGENPEPVKPDVTRQEWILWARPVWYAADYEPGHGKHSADGGISESDTLNIQEARGDRDERHICPLQLGVIERCVRLWSNPGDTVLSPFAGIGSEGYVSLQHGRQFVGIELKPEYYRVALRNLDRAATVTQPPLLEYLETVSSNGHKA